MSTSEFENEWDEQHVASSLLLRRGLGLPEDFTVEDMAFAQEMETLFAPEKEELPPYFVQTLLEAETPRFQPVEHGLEHKTRARVFRRLKLRRRLFRSNGMPFFSLAQHAIRPPRSVLALLVACLLFVVFTMVATGPSFASGLNVLFTGRHSGVLQVDGYPRLSPTKAKNSSGDTTVTPSPKKITLLEAQQQLEFPIHRPLSLPERYMLSSIYLYQGIDQSWADGPAIELEYTYERQGGASHGTGKISVCEFKPLGQVLQVVQLGAAHSLQIGRNGHAQAIYVDGQWVHISKFSHDWVYGGRSEIIYEHNGVIFWIVGDQRDGIGQKALLDVANSLQPFDMRAIHMVGHINSVVLSSDNAIWPFADDIVYTDEPNGSSLEVINAGFPSLSVHVSLHQTSGR
ncbi:MAG: hypothetical protein NVS4B1_10410 [Ktedonobacteraceae bacterium]